MTYIKKVPNITGLRPLNYFLLLLSPFICLVISTALQRQQNHQKRRSVYQVPNKQINRQKTTKDVHSNPLLF